MRIERHSRTLTVLFTDLVASTGLMSELGETAFDGLRRAHFAGLREALVLHGGNEVKTMGDGLVATFDSAVDGVRCAVALQQTTRWQARSEGVPLEIRVGLSLGEVTVEDGDVFGTPVVEAARLVSMAQTGQILATGLVQIVAQARLGVDFSDLGPMEVKGLPQPVPVVEVAWEPLAADLPLPPHLAGERQFAFVGRQSEVTVLQNTWKEVEGGQCRVALLAGEPGVGKTRLAIELARSVHAAGAVVLAGRCDEGLGVPYQPFVEALRHLVTQTPVPRLAGRLGRLAGELSRLVPEVAAALPELPAPLRSDPETERYRLFDALAAWLSALGEGEPTLLVLDDLQWAARPTLLLLRHIIRSPEPTRLLIVGTYRDSEVRRDDPFWGLLADLRREGSVKRLALSGLDTEAVAALVEGAAGHELTDDDLQVVRAIHAETQGNPFFVGEVLNHLAELGIIADIQRRKVRRRWTRLALESLGIPQGAREMVGRRLSRLSEETNRVLTLGAVVGGEFEFAVLRTAGSFEEEALMAALEEGVAARLLEETPWPSLHYRFAHALVRATLYEDLSAARRKALHRRVGEAIEDVHRSGLDEQLPALALHFAMACEPSDTSRAVRYATRAGDRALALLAPDDAVRYYRQALELHDSAEAAPDPGLRCDLLIALGEAQRRAGERAHRETLLEAARLAGELDDADRMTRAALANNRGFFSISNEVDAARVEVFEAALDALGPGDSALRARLLVTLAVELVFSSEHERLPRLLAEGLSMARRVGDPTTTADVLARGYVATFASLDIEALRGQTEELGRLAEELGDPALEFWASTWGFMTAVLVADISSAERLIITSTKVASDVGQPFMQWIATFGRSHLARILGRPEEAEALAVDAFELAQAAGAPDAFRMFGIQLFWIRYDQGRVGEMIDLFTGALSREDFPPLSLAAYCLTLCELGRLDEARLILDQLAATGFALPFAWLFGATMLAAAAAMLGSEHGLALYERLAPHHALLATNGATTIGPVAHYLGLLARSLGRDDDALAHFEEALATEKRIGASAWLAETGVEYAQCLLARAGPQDIVRGRHLLRTGLDTARQLGLPKVERRAETLLGAAGENPFESAPGPVDV